MVITQPKNQPQWWCLIPLPMHTITSGINRIVVLHTERVRAAMSDKRLWHKKSCLKPEKLFEMKEKIGYIEQGGKIKGKKEETGKSKNDTSWVSNAKSWSQIHSILSSWCAAPQNIPVCLMGFGFSPFGNKFKVHRPRKPSGEDCMSRCYLKTAFDFLIFTMESEQVGLIL